MKVITVKTKGILSNLRKLDYLQYSMRVPRFFIVCFMMFLILSGYCSSSIVTAGPTEAKVELSSPIGGEYISGLITIEWKVFLVSDIQVVSYLYLSHKNEETWQRINTDQLIDCESFEWNSSSVIDGSYQMKVVSVTKENYITSDTSDIFVIDNDNSNLLISDVYIIDSASSIKETIKNGDDVYLEANIENAGSLLSNEISADLSGLGFSSKMMPDYFDGLTAVWTLTNVICQPKDGAIKVTVQVADIEQKSIVVVSDNTKPSVSIVKPSGGLYIVNTRIFPLTRSIHIGSLLVNIDCDDMNGIERTEIYIDASLEYIFEGNMSEWILTKRLFGNHVFRIIVYDGAGNKAESSLVFTIFNIF